MSDCSFKIGNVVVKNPVVSAPLAGISDNTYRIFSKAFGSALNFTEMISSYGIHFNSKESISLSYITEFERPCGIQVFGFEPEIILEAAQKMENTADLIDINMGCPVPKVLKSKSGGYLLNDEKRIAEIISKITLNIKKPLTIKFRTGWDKNNINIERVAKIAEANGAAAITIHGRTVKQGFSGEVNYEIIKDVKKKIKIPVIISGDINTPFKAKRVLDFTGCDAVMIGRAVKGRQWIFFNMLMAFCDKNYPLNSNINSNDNISDNINDNVGKNNIDENNLNIGLNHSNYLNYHPLLVWRKKFAELYLKFIIHFKGEEKAVKEFRKYLSWIFKGVAGIGKVKKKIFTISDYREAISIINSISG